MDLTPRSWLLGAWLRHLRGAAQLTALDVADKYLQCSQSRVYSIESGSRTLNKLELEGLVCGAYGRPELLPRMEGLRGRSATSPSDEIIRDQAAKHPDVMIVHGLEGESDSAYGVIIDQIPKLCQTAEYMMVQHRLDGHSEDDVDKYTTAGLERQRRFFESNSPPRTWIVITEGALDRATHVDGQLELLYERAQHPALIIMVIPHAAGPHPSFSSFTIIEFEGGFRILYTDHVTGGSITVEPSEAQAAMARWKRLGSIALDPTTTLDVIESKMRH